MDRQRLTFWRTSLTARLVVNFLLLGVIIISLVGYLAYVRAQGALHDSIIDRLEALALFKEVELKRWISDQRDDVQMLASAPDIQAAASALLSAEPGSAAYDQAAASLKAHFQAFKRSKSGLAEILILSNRGGQVLFSTEPVAESDYRSSDEYFVRGRQELFIQNVYASPLTLKPTITIAAPLFDSAQERRGVLVAHLNLARMDQIILDRSGLGQTGETYLVDKNNVFVTSERFGRQEFPRGVHTAGIDAAVAGHDGADLYLNYAGQPVIGVHRWLEEHDLALLVEMSQDEAFAPVHHLAWTIGAVGLGLVAVLALAVHFLARRIARPVLAISDTARAVAAGDLSRQAPVLTSDEIGVLARSFNHMTDQVSRLYQGLEEKVRELGAAQAALHESEEKYRSIFENATEGIFQTTPDGRYLNANPALAAICGYVTPAELIEDTIDLGRQFYVDPGRRTELKRLLEEHGAVYDFESQIYRRDRSIIWVSENIRVNRAADGTILYYEGTLEDITARKQAEEHLQHHSEELEAEVAERTRALVRSNAQLHQLASELGEKNLDLMQGLALARDIQLGLLPDRAPWPSSSLAVCGRSLPASEVGGDFYTYIAQREQRAAIAIGDISGKGIGAALLMALTANAVEERTRESEHPGQILEALNTQLTPRLKINRMNAAVLHLVIDLAAPTLWVANAGMISPLLVREGRIAYIDVGGLPLGALDHNTYAEQRVDLQRGDLIVLVSDGVVEAQNEEGEMFGFDRLEAILSEHGRAAPEPLTDFILEQVSAFMGIADQHDDITLICLRV